MVKKSKSLDWENHTEWVLSWWREFSGQPLTRLWRHILSGCCQVCDWGIQYIWRIVRAGGCSVVIAQWQNTDCTSQVSWVQFPMTVSLFTSSISPQKHLISLLLFSKLLLLLKQWCNVLCDKILQHDWTALYSTMGHGFSSPDPSLSCGSGSGLRD